jgi:diguanylate cyclase (GGDEF)-like protein
VLIIAAILVLSFMMADLAMLPESLHQIYIINRAALQSLAVLALFALSFWKQFQHYYQITLALLLIWMSYVNYAFIIKAWQLEQFSFPYEGTLLYAFFGFYVLRLSFRHAIYVLLATTIGFFYVVHNYPVYGEKNFVSLGFVFSSQLIGLVGLYNLRKTIDRLNAANEQLKELSEIDQLTGIYNRRHYENRSEEVLAWCRRSGYTLAVFMVDIDYFKDFNDGYGHQKGDDTIVIQADILKELFQREWDIVARYGGEEFVVIAPNLTVEQAQQQAQRILDAWSDLAVEHTKGQGDGHVSCSIGVCVGTPKEHHSVKHMVSCADKALYDAKSSGRAKYVIFAK